jgi:hypothetical protein
MDTLPDMDIGESSSKALIPSSSSPIPSSSSPIPSSSLTIPSSSPSIPSSTSPQRLVPQHPVPQRLVPQLAEDEKSKHTATTSEREGPKEFDQTESIF